MIWRRTQIADDGSHHRLDDRPLYAERFDAVGKFHAPGLAPVRRGAQAWHIDASGQPRYAARFRQCFGYYEDRAAVDDGTSWFHVDPEGASIGPARHAWCGNFQNGAAPVRDFEGQYHHLDRSGNPLYDERWRYAGDFRDGIAVVQSQDGRSTHVDLRGRLVHGLWFEDLDVFHKGWARARDTQGWTHVDAMGRPGYARRFAAVEPFYNGQARVETFAGGLEIIDERGQTLVVLRTSEPTDFTDLSTDLVGVWRTRTIACAVDLGIFDRLPADEATLAHACALPQDSLRRLMRALGELRLVTWTEPLWTSLAKGELLRADHPLSLADAALDYAGPLDQAWRSLADALRSPDQRLSPSWFERLATQAESLRRHHRSLRSYARFDYARVASLDLFDGARRVVDAGGGTGTLAELLLTRHPTLEVVLLERPEVLALRQPDTPGLVVRAGDLFEDWGISVDVAILARILHDWPDDEALRILARARAAIGERGCVVIVDMVVANHGEPDHRGGLCDLHLLVTHRGRERDPGQWSRLLDRAGLSLERVVDLGAVPSAIVARPV